MRFLKTALTTVVILLSLHSLAQDEKTSWITLSGNLNSIWIVNQNNYGNPLMDYSTKFGTGAYLGFARIVKEKFGFNLSAGYSRFGQDYSGELLGADATRKLTMHYVQVPVMLMFKTRKYPSPAWFEAGPQMTFLTDARQNFSRDNGGDPLIKPEYLIPGDTAVKERFNNMDLMLTLRYYSLHELDRDERLFLRIGFETAFGFLDINSKEYRIPAYRTNTYKASHNYYIGLQLGLMFRPKK